MTHTAGAGLAGTLRDAGARRFSDAKVPHVALVFWLVKVLTTGTGEAASDFVAELPAMVAAVVLALLFAGFVVLMRGQLRATRYSAVRYWGCVAMIAVFGTMAADVIHVVVGNAVTTVAYVLLLAAVLWAWHRSEGSISIHSITTARREWFYWATVAATFALGTAAGDFAADTVGLGYRDAAVVFGLLMLIVAAAWRCGVVPTVPAFWAAYVLTRPFGASLADWFGKPRAKTGLNMGDGVVTLVGASLVVLAIAWLARSGADQPRDEELTR